MSFPSAASVFPPLEHHETTRKRKRDGQEEIIQLDTRPLTIKVSTYAIDELECALTSVSLTLRIRSQNHEYLHPYP